MLGVRFGGSLEEVMRPALEHLSMHEDATVDCTVTAWDEATTGVGLPPIPATAAPGVGPFRLRARDFAGLDAWYVSSSAGLSMLGADGSAGFAFLKDGRTAPLDARAAPFLAILNWWQRLHGAQLVHGGAVAVPGVGAALIVGPSGAGKSTTALACADAGLVFLGDDYVLVEADPEPRVFPLYRSGKITAAHSTFIPGLRGRAADASAHGDDKVAFFLHGANAAATPGGWPIRLILLPRVVGVEPCRRHPSSASDVLRALAPSTLLQLPGGGAADLARLARLASSVPAFRFDLGGDARAIAGCVADALGRPT